MSNAITFTGHLDHPRLTIIGIAGLLAGLPACESTSLDGEAPTGTTSQALDLGCADGIAEQSFDDFLFGCAGQVTFDNRLTLCGAGLRMATASEWKSRPVSGLVPMHDYWTDDALNFGGSGSSNCFVSTTMGTTCGESPMRVCTASGTDPEGNHCRWQHCGLDTISPDEFFGGCAGDTTAGALCINSPGLWNLVATCDHGNCSPDPHDPLGDPDLRVVIPDADLTGARVKLNVAPSGLELRRVTVDVNITHPFIGDLVIQVIAPSGQVATLSNRQGGSADNFVVRGRDITSSFTGGSVVSGTWQLFVRDLAAADVGTINSFGLHISSAN